jgi:hypothetical protein
MFCAPQPSSADLERISLAMREQIHSAEEKLDELAAEAKWEALHHAPSPVGLYLLVDHTRELSRR